MMNTPKHTPGPWACNVWMVGNNVPTGEITISGPEGDEHICTMDGNEDNLANGNLIAAAPAMYAALREAEKHLTDLANYGAEGIPEPLLVSVRSAIAQAEGRSA